MLNDLLLLSGNDIPLIEAQLIIHQPTIKEIAYIGEENFYLGCEFLTFSKNRLTEEDRKNNAHIDDFIIFLSLLQDHRFELQKSVRAAIMVLSLIFPYYSLSFERDKIMFKNENTNEIKYLLSQHFISFKTILSEMFCLRQSGVEETYNPQSGLAQKIADKLNKRHQTLAQQKNQNEKKVAILSRYVSILTTGTQKDMQSYFNYTVYQLFDEFQRFELKLKYDINFKAKLAGATDLPEVEDWMKDIHS